MDKAGNARVYEYGRRCRKGGEERTETGAKCQESVVRYGSSCKVRTGKKCTVKTEEGIK